MSRKERPIYRPSNAAITAAVVLLHIAGLYALQSGLLGRAVNIVIPVVMLSELVEAPLAMKEPSPQRPKNAPALQPKTTPKVATLSPAVQPLAIQDTTPSPAAPSEIASLAATAPSNEVPQSPSALSTLPPVASHLPVSTKVELPSSQADYLNNPLPAYPAVSRRLGETGKVIVRVYINSDGVAQNGEVRSSSGFERLDAAALAAALKWRYLPGKRGGVAEAMWVNVPVAFTLN